MESLAGYELTERLPTEGMSEVWEARDERERRAVVKRLGLAALDRPAMRARAVDASAALASFEHPAFVRVLAPGEDDRGRPFVILDRVGGGSLRAQVRATGPLEPARVAAIVTAVAGALDALHRAGVTYADAKTGNVLVTPGRTVLAHSWLSFANAADPARYLDREQFAGTIDYVAPEVIRGEAPTLASDVYGLGCAAFECLTGDVPFSRPTEDATLDAHLEEDPPSTGDAAVDAVVRRALAKDPARRFATASKLAESLAEAARVTG